MESQVSVVESAAAANVSRPRLLPVEDIPPLIIPAVNIHAGEDTVDGYNSCERDVEEVEAEEEDGKVEAEEAAEEEDEEREEDEEDDEDEGEAEEAEEDEDEEDDVDEGDEGEAEDDGEEEREAEEEEGEENEVEEDETGIGAEEEEEYDSDASVSDINVLSRKRKNAPDSCTFAPPKKVKRLWLRATIFRDAYLALCASYAVYGCVELREVQRYVQYADWTVISIAMVIDFMTKLSQDSLRRKGAMQLLKITLERYRDRISDVSEFTYFLGIRPKHPDFENPAIYTIWRNMDICTFVNTFIPVMINVAAECEGCCDYVVYSRVNRFVSNARKLRLRCRNRFFVYFAEIIFDRFRTIHCLENYRHEIADRFRDAMRKGATPLAVPLSYFIDRDIIAEEAERMRALHKKKLSFGIRDTTVPSCHCHIVQNATDFMYALRRPVPSHTYLDNVISKLITPDDDTLTNASFRELFRKKGLFIDLPVYMPQLEAMRNAVLKSADYYISQLKDLTVYSI